MKNTNKRSANVSLVIPVYNNEATLNEQLRKCIRELGAICKSYEIIISNDNSTDNTGKLLDKFNKNKHIRIYHQKKNLGIAGNILFLYKKAKHSFILLFSIDGDWQPRDIARLITSAEKYGADIVVGKRDIKKFRFKRRVVSFVYNILPPVLFGVKTYDAGSIKILRKEIIDTIPLQLRTVAVEAEILIKAAKKGYKIIHIPVTFKKHKNNKFSGVNTKLITHTFIDLVKLRLLRN